MFAKSYAFVKDLQGTRVRTLRNELKQAKKIGDEDSASRIKKLLNEEAELMG